MGLSTYIAYANRFELYNYEKNISLRGSKRKSKTDYGSEVLRNDGESSLDSRLGWSEAKKQKRKDNARRCSMVFKRLVISNLQGYENPLLITFTYRENKTSVSESYRDLTSCIQSLRYKFGKTFKYICVPEFQKRGAVHFHALFWGIKKEVLGIPRQYPNGSIDSYFWSYGFTLCKETNGSHKIASYLSKYMAKSFQDPRLASQKSYVASRNVIRPIYGSVTSKLALSYVIDDFVGVDNYPIQSRSYMTQYLGNCDYQLFNIK